MAKRASTLPALPTLEDVTFDAETHTSTLADGRAVPHVTSVLVETKIATDFEAILLYAGERLELARARGTAVHADCHAYDDNDLEMSSVHPDVRPYVEAWAQFRADLGIEPEVRERRIFHPVYFYTGIMDGIFYRGGHGHVLIDIKTGDPEDSGCYLQTVAYETAWRQMTQMALPMERWGVQLTPRNKVPYRITNYSAQADAASHFHKWLAALCTYNEQHGRRKKA